jgi:hypothetical protein
MIRIGFSKFIAKAYILPSLPDVMCNGVLEALLGRADNGDAAK